MKSELAYLAHRCSELDKYRVETCCIIGKLATLPGVPLLRSSDVLMCGNFLKHGVEIASLSVNTYAGFYSLCPVPTSVRSVKL